MAIEESVEQPNANNREDTLEPKGIHDSLHTSTSTISADDDVKEESTSKKEESDSEPISQGDNISDPSREVDFVEPSKRAQLDYSTYDKNSFSSDVGNSSPIAGLDSRKNPFEERGDDTCMRGVKLSIMDKELKLFDGPEKSGNFGRLFGWDPGFFG